MNNSGLQTKRKTGNRKNGEEMTPLEKFITEN